MLTVGQKIKELREARGWTQLELSLQADKAQSAIWTFESGKYYPKLPDLQRICDAFGMTISEFMEGVEII